MRSRMSVRAFYAKTIERLRSCCVMEPIPNLNQKRRKRLKTDLTSRRAFQVHESQLDNGLRVLLVENPSIPTVSMNASILAGARYDTDEKAGLAIMASRLLDEGTQTRSSLEIAEAIESVGGAIETDGSSERIVASAGVLKKDIDLGLDLLADILMHPAFPDEFVEKEKERTLSEIASAKDRPQVIR